MKKSFPQCHREASVDTALYRPFKLADQVSDFVLIDSDQQSVTIRGTSPTRRSSFTRSDRRAFGRVGSRRGDSIVIPCRSAPPPNLYLVNLGILDADPIQEFPDRVRDLRCDEPHNDLTLALSLEGFLIFGKLRGIFLTGGNCLQFHR